MSKLPGVLSDPWRKSVAPRKEPTQKEPAESLPSAHSSYDVDNYDTRFATIELKGYGGITVEGTGDIPVAAIRILRFCREEKAAIDPIFEEYGVVITNNVKKEPTHVSFYIQASDGWLLAVPHAKTRDEGALQLIQAMMHLNTIAAFRDKLKKAKIRPYKM